MHYHLEWALVSGLMLSATVDRHRWPPVATRYDEISMHSTFININRIAYIVGLGVSPYIITHIVTTNDINCWRSWIQIQICIEKRALACVSSLIPKMVWYPSTNRRSTSTYHTRYTNTLCVTKFGGAWCIGGSSNVHPIHSMHLLLRTYSSFPFYMPVVIKFNCILTNSKMVFEFSHFTVYSTRRAMWIDAYRYTCTHTLPFWSVQFLCG